ncbi:MULTISPECIES: UTRA domain-containing protein [Vibrio]|uniref:UTRA domain-containing protein n=2 Tax=Vibrio TaxID=662 RepID=A0A7X4RWI3_9VIBR|nr:UTRA domain-containing protein [Vibrio nitrifigilis]MBF9002907.1 UTRA domain-containing protein [Vibrio nitrifigilis]MZI95244.1 UTRA domain-containing protein [Vibrio eleionomae]
MQYVKIKQAILDQIEAGTLSPQQKLPSERKLAESFNTTRVTLREALSLLESEGAIYREDRRGWFIAAPPLSYDPNQLVSFRELTAQQNRVGYTMVISNQSQMANKAANRLLGLAPFSDMQRIERVRHLDKRPVAYVTSYLIADVSTHLENIDVQHSLTDVLHQEFGVDWQKIEYRILVGSLQGDIAVALYATEGTPALVIEKVLYDTHGSKVRADVEYWRHDVVVLQGQSTFS